MLVCGCLVGMYETWHGRVVEILDGCGDRCRYPDQRINRVLGVAFDGALGTVLLAINRPVKLADDGDVT